MEGYQPTIDDVRESLKADGIDIPIQQPSQKKGFLQQAGELAGKFNRGVESIGLPSMAAHFLSAPLHAAANVANVPGDISNLLFGTHVPKVQVPSGVDPVSYLPKDQSGTQNAMGFAGDILGDVISGGGAYKGAEKLLNLGAKTPLYLRSLLGGATGASVSDSDQPLGRIGGAALGAAAPAISGLGAKKIGSRAADIFKENIGKSSKGYSNLFEEAESSRANKNLKVPDVLKDSSEEMDKFFKHTDVQHNASLRRFINNPTLENAHDAQSDLGKISRILQGKLDKGGNLSSGQQDAMNIAKDIQKRVRGSMQSAFFNANRPDLALKYAQETESYAKNVAPLKSEPDISKYLSGKIKASKLGRNLISSNKFSGKDISSQIPGYGARKLLSDIPAWQKVLGASAVMPALSASGVPIPYYLRKLIDSYSGG